ncbi:MAG: Co2+/Mg2+ efflux protein ApaG [Planctomycetes bacterium]|nr:Co2+/Mg2+ efflux protein ApaG [Planctomycetota bacterium]
MPTTALTSDTITQGIRVDAHAFYLPDESDPTIGKYLFGYRISITNEGDAPAQLVSRHWLIIDADGHREEVNGPGVVGKTPRLEPGESFEYTSHCPLGTEWGTMQGEYQMKRDDGTPFEARIGRFFLTRQHEAKTA